MTSPINPLLSALMPFDFETDVVSAQNITFSFLDPGVPLTIDDLGTESVTLVWTEAQKQNVRDLFAYTETIIDRTFEEVADPSAAIIEFGHIAEFFDGTTGYTEQLGDQRSQIVVSTEHNDFDDVTLIHEIGHALGLSHPFDGPANLPGVTRFDDPGDFGLNNELATRMAYNPGVLPENPGLDIIGEAFSFGALDIPALQHLYGANTTTGLGDTSYGIDSKVITIWDNGGNDRIDFSGATDDAVIDLRAATYQTDGGAAGYFSFVGNEDGTVANGGYTISDIVVIEDARGGEGDDRITGNAVNNLLSGNGGDDRIDGGDGMDTGLYTGNQESYTLTLNAQEATLTDRREGGEGTDTLVNIEALAFGDNTGGPFDLTKFAGTQMLSEAQMESFIELYIAYFDRAPDAVGLNFWGTAFATGTSLQEMAALFAEQAETMAAYPEGLSNAELATIVYDNVLGREADAAGFDFWVGVLDSGGRTRDQFILSVLEGAKTPIAGATPEQAAQQSADQAFLSAKTDIGAYYSVIKGLSDVGDASAAMALFDGTADSLMSVQNAIDGYYAEALDAESGAFILQLVGVLDDPFGGAMV